MKSLKLNIVCQNQEVKLPFKQISSITLPTLDGVQSIRVGHEPLFSQLKEGKLIIKSLAQELVFYIEGSGFLEALPTHVTIYAEKISNIKEDKKKTKWQKLSQFKNEKINLGLKKSFTASIMAGNFPLRKKSLKEHYQKTYGAKKTKSLFQFCQDLIIKDILAENFYAEDILDIGSTFIKYYPQISAAAKSLTSLSFLPPYFRKIKKISKKAPIKYSLVISNLGLHMFKDLNSFCRQLKKASSKNQRIIFSLLNPLFFKQENYFKKSKAVNLYREFGSLVSFLLPLKEYLNPFIQQGFVLKSIYEPEISKTEIKKYPGLKKYKNSPILYICDLTLNK